MLLRSGWDPVKRLLDAMVSRWKVVREVINRRLRRNPIGQGLLLALWGFLYANILIAYVVLTIFGGIAVSVLGVLLQLLLIVLLILTLVPQFQGFAISAQLALAAGLAG